MRIIKITEHKKEKMSDYAEKMLKYGGKLMQCIEELEEDDMGERYEDDDDDDDDDEGYRNDNYRRGGDIGERRRRNRRTGRFM